MSSAIILPSILRANTFQHLGCTLQKCVFGHVQTRKAQISLPDVQASQDPHCLLIESLGTAEYD